MPEMECESSRRNFLSKASCAVFAALVASGVAAGDALAFPIFETSAEAAEGSDRSYPLPSVDGASIDQNSQVILVRSANHIYAFALACPHQNAALRWRPQDRLFQCPRHGAKYRPDGIFISGHPTRNMDRFALHLEGEKVVVDLSKLYRSDQQANLWEAAFCLVICGASRRLSLASIFFLRPDKCCRTMFLLSGKSDLINSGTMSEFTIDKEGNWHYRGMEMLRRDIVVLFYCRLSEG